MTITTLMVLVMVLVAMKLLIIAVMVKRTMVVKIALLTIKRICFSRLFLTQHAGDPMCEWRGHSMTCTKSVLSLSVTPHTQVGGRGCMCLKPTCKYQVYPCIARSEERMRMRNKHKSKIF